MANMLMIQADKCTGCHNCMLACSMTHEASFRISAARVHVYTWEREGFSVPMMCQHCRDAPCIPVCTVNAMTRDPLTGWVNLDQGKCIGCKMCVHACPFGNSVWDEGSHKILKCDYCGGDPACAKFCPTQAIQWVDDVAATQSRKRAFAAKFKAAFTE
jgi:anaerobic carbon-monoxide dehydrogenase iron sulfur subunit